MEELQKEPSVESNNSNFELSSLDLIEQSKSYDEGLESLYNAFKSIPDDQKETAAAVLQERTEDLNYYYKKPYFNQEETFEYAPVEYTPYEPTASQEDKIKSIDDWEEKNLSTLDQIEDPEYKALAPKIKRSVEMLASTSRREIYGNRGEGLVPFLTDKAYRVAQGAIGLPATAIGYPEVSESLMERTDPERDGTLTSDLAGFGGQMAGAATAVGGGAAIGSLAGPGGTAAGATYGATAYGVAQAAGAARQQYTQNLEETGDQTRSLVSGAIEGGAQIIESTIVGRGLGRGIKAATSAGLGQKAATGLIGAGLEGAGGEAASQVVSNIAEGVGKDEEIDFLEGTGRAALLGAIAGAAPGALGETYAKYKNFQQEKLAKQMLDVISEQEAKKTQEVKEVLNNTPPDILDTPIPATSTEEARKTSGDTVDVMNNNLYGPLPDYDPESFYSENTEREYNNYEAIQNLNKQEDPEAAIEDQIKLEQAKSEVDDLLDSNPFVDLAATEQAFPDLNQPTTPQEGIKPIADQGPVQRYSDDYLNKIDEMTPSPFTSLLAKLIGTEIQTKDKLVGAYGNSNAQEKRVQLLRALGADPVKMMKVLAHEIGHQLDLNNFKTAKDLTNRVAAPIIERLDSLASMLDARMSRKYEDPFMKDTQAKIQKEAEDLSKQWRPGWTDVADPYRSNSKEVIADVFSALINNPRYVKKNFPNLFKTFESGVAKDPTTSQAWDMILDFQNNPDKAREFLKEQRVEDFKRETVARQKQIEKQKALQNKTLWEKAKTVKDHFFIEVFDSSKYQRDLTKKLKGLSKEEAVRALHEMAVQKNGALKNEFNRKIGEPTKKILDKFKRNGIEITTWDQFERVNHLEKETTATIEQIRKNPLPYFELANWLVNANITYAETGRPVMRDYEGKIEKAIESGDPELLIEALAQSPIARNSDIPFTYQDVEASIQEADPAIKKALAKKAYKDKVLLYEKQNKIPADEAIKKRFQAEITANPNSNLKQYSSLLDEILSPNSFNIRRYLLNAGGEHLFEAKEQLAYLTKDLSNEQRAVLAEGSKEWHTALSSLVPLFKEAGIFEPNLMSRIELNQDNYVTAAVLKYFEQDPEFSASIKSSYGSLDSVGNSITGTLGRMEAIMFRARKQTAINSTVDLAIKHDEAVPVVLENPLEAFTYAKTQTENSLNPHGYLVKAADGKYTVYQVPKTAALSVYRSRVQDAPVIKFVGNMAENFNKLFAFKPLATILNPAFYVRQKMMDHFNEVARAGSFVRNSKVKEFNKEAKAFLKGLMDEKSWDTLKKDHPELYDAFFELNIASDQLGQSLDEDFISAADSIYEMSLDDYNPNIGKGTLDKWQDSIVKLLNKATFGGAEKLSSLASQDEIRTKLVGYQIGKMKGMSDLEAANFARDRFGTPDPMGGGRQSPIFNRYLSFGRAYLNGLRNVANLYQESSGIKGQMVFWTHIALPRLLSSPVIFPFLIGQMFGKGSDEEKVFQELNNRIPQYDRLAKICQGVGFLDENGNYVSIEEAKADLSKINAKWKTIYTAIPQTREHMAVAATFWPAIEALWEGEISKASSEFASGAGRALSGSIQPLFEILSNAAALAIGNNPQDFFRQKDILPQDLAAAGNPIEKTWEYLKYKGSSLIPFVPFDRFKVSSLEEPQGVIENTLTSIPLASNIIRSGVRASNYGLWEKLKGDQEDKKTFNASVKLLLPDSIKLAALEAGKVSQFELLEPKDPKTGKRKKSNLPPEEQARYARVALWRNRIYKPAIQDLKRFYEVGDMENFDRISKRLERQTRSYRLFPENSSAGEEFSDD